MTNGPCPWATTVPHLAGGPRQREVSAAPHPARHDSPTRVLRPRHSGMINLGTHESGMEPRCPPLTVRSEGLNQFDEPIFRTNALVFVVRFLDDGFAQVDEGMHRVIDVIGKKMTRWSGYHLEDKRS